MIDKVVFNDNGSYCWQWVDNAELNQDDLDSVLITIGKVLDGQCAIYGKVTDDELMNSVEYAARVFSERLGEEKELNCFSNEDLLTFYGWLLGHGYQMKTISMIRNWIGNHGFAEKVRSAQ